MNGQQQGQGVNIEDLSREDLVRIVMRENVELLIVINELQQSLGQAQAAVERPDQLQFPTD